MGVRLGAAQVTQVAAGGMHSVALTPEGELWTTGVNDEGALGRHTGCWPLDSLLAMLSLWQHSAGPISQGNLQAWRPDGYKMAYKIASYIH
jgi:alpha-tubulin suppressor-like RCC1 family protein